MGGCSVLNGEADEEKRVIKHHTNNFVGKDGGKADER